MNAGGGGLPWKAIVVAAVVLAALIYFSMHLFAGAPTLPTGDAAGVNHPGEHADFGNVTVGPDGNPVNSAAPSNAQTGSGQ